MIRKKLFLYEVALLHIITWWGIRIFSPRFLFTGVALGTPERWLIRLLRAVAVVLIIFIWIKLRKFSFKNIGIGGKNFWKYFFIGFFFVVILWIMIKGYFPGGSKSYTLKLLAIITAFMDVLAQQISTFGLIQKMMERKLGIKISFLSAWLSFGLAHFFISPSLTGVFIAFSAGLLFGLTLWKTKNLGAGLGMHSGFHFMLAIYYA